MEETRFRAIIDGFSDPILIVDGYETMRYVNAEFLRAFEYTFSDIIGRPFEDVLPQEDRASVATALARAHATTGTVHRCEHRILTRAGATEIVETSINPLEDPVGGSFTILHLRIVTARKQAEETLQASEERYRQLIEHSHDLIQSVAPDGRLRFINRTLLETLEYSEADVPQLSLWEILHPKARAQCKAYFAALWQGKEVGILRLSFLSKRGTTVDVEGVAVLQREQGQAVAINTFLRDVTEQRRSARIQAARFAVTEILAASPELEVALHQALVAIATNLDWQVAELWMPDSTGEQLRRQDTWQISAYLELNAFAAASRTFTFSRHEGLPGRCWATGEVIWEEDLACSPTFRRTALVAQAGLRTAVAVPIIEGRTTIGVMLFFSRAARPIEPSLAVVLADLGVQLGQCVARKTAEAALQAERALLAQRVEQRTNELIRVNADLARALHAKDRFLATMSHELRTPLNTILALSEVLIDQFHGPINPKQQTSLRSIETSGKHLLSLINDILDLSKVEAGQLKLLRESVAVSDICQISLLFVHELALKKQLKLAFQLNDQLALFEVDARRMKQMLVNLLANAVKFTPPGGTVCLNVDVQAEAGWISFAVQDTGIGIAPEDQARLFQPFTQLESNPQQTQEGTGLGLALVRRLAELHGGSVSVESTPGQGSCFTITLPYSTAQAHARRLPSEHTPTSAAQVAGSALSIDDAALTVPDTQPMPTAEPAPGLNPKQALILLADDNESNIIVIGDYLRDHGYHVAIARNGREGLEQVAALQPDLLLLDIQMPVIDGLEVARRLRAEPQYARLPILVLTALAMPGDRERCLQAGANAYMTKPVSLKQLVATIKQLLA